MVFLGGSRHAAGRRYNRLHATTMGAALLFTGAALLSGCGGGGGNDDPNPNPTPTPNTNATVSGRIIEDTTRGNVAGAVIRLGTATATTGANGEFSLELPGGGGAQSLRVELPSDQFQSTGTYREDRCVSLASTGIRIEANRLESGDRTILGDISVFNRTTSPPPPPCNF